MTPVTCPDDVKPGDHVRYEPHYSRNVASYDGVVVRVTADRVTVKGADGKTHIASYSVMATSSEWGRAREKHYNLNLLDARDLWLRAKPVRLFGSSHHACPSPIFAVGIDALIEHRDEVVAELDALRAWLMREPTVTP